MILASHEGLTHPCINNQEIDSWWNHEHLFVYIIYFALSILMASRKDANDCWSVFFLEFLVIIENMKHTSRIWNILGELSNIK